MLHSNRVALDFAIWSPSIWFVACFPTLGVFPAHSEGYLYDLSDQLTSAPLDDGEGLWDLLLWISAKVNPSEGGKLLLGC